VTKKEDVCNLSHPGWVVCCFQKCGRTCTHRRAVDEGV